jgi:hypothetical protein
MKANVAVIKTSPGTVLNDYSRLMDMAGYRDFISPESETLIKLNLSWTKYFPRRVGKKTHRRRLRKGKTLPR